MDAVHSGIVVCCGGTLSLVQKGQTRGCSMPWTQWINDIWWWGHCLWCKKVKPEDAMDAVRSGIVVCCGGTLSLVQKGQTRGCSMPWTQWINDIWWWGHCIW